MAGKNNCKSNSRFYFENKPGAPLKSKRSQVTIFVIVALIVIVSIALIYLLASGKIGLSLARENPKAYISKCAGDSAKEAVEKLLPHGGYLNPSEPTLLYEKEKVAYLCYTEDDETLCKSREPQLSANIEKEIKDYISPLIEKCFGSLKDSLKNYNPEFEGTNIEVEIKPKQIIISINKKISYTKDEQTIAIEKFDASVSSKMWDFVRLTNQIINEEVSCNCKKEACNADILQISLDNDGIEAEKFVTGRNEEIYMLTDEISEDKFIFAVRNCIRLPW